MTRNDETTTLGLLMDLVSTHGTAEMAQTMTQLLNLAMQFERENHLQARLYERSDQRRGVANGYKPKTVRTLLGPLAVSVPQAVMTDGSGESFYPSALEKGLLSERALLTCMGEMYFRGISTRKVTAVFEKCLGMSVSSTQVSRAAKLLDEELAAWRERRLGRVRYLQLDARYEKVRMGGAYVDCALLSAVGVTEDGTRRVMGLSVALSEAEVHWRGFLESLCARGMHGVEYIVSDDHSGLKAARQKVLPSVRWQRCQAHLSRNAQDHCPRRSQKAILGEDLRSVWSSSSREDAQQQLDRLVARYRPSAPKLADWLEANIPEGFTVYELPSSHRRKMRTSNMTERNVQQELLRRTRVCSLFCNEESLLRLGSAVLMELDTRWLSQRKRYITWEDTTRDGLKQISRKDVA
ncbi:MAG: IS256 family transposase [bacterium]|nr:IS256 family transposase [bacterium]